MAAIASRSFLARLRALYPPSGASYVQKPWYHVAGAAYAAANRPEGVSAVYRMASQELGGPQHPDQLLLARRMRDAIFHTSINCGFARSINALIALKDATPDSFRDVQPLRDVTRPIVDVHEQGIKVFQAAYGPTAGPVEDLLNSISPDFWFCIKTTAYGFTFGYNELLSPKEVSFAIIAALVATDAPRQLGWHLHNAVRNGATPDEARAVRQICMEVSKECGVRWQGELPDLGNGDSQNV
ncbi:hypothetical protein AURDEDRAFT_63596 [Auricularia subglabra TFB-10046 SS5]|nr:hypothetical protein AURDEDRAFT_63596 [Auricularia subglabra TFB-10046 SS5]